MAKKKCKSEGGIANVYIDSPLASDTEFKDYHTITFDMSKPSKAEIKAAKALYESLKDSCYVLWSDKEVYCVKHNRDYKHCTDGRH